MLVRVSYGLEHFIGDILSAAGVIYFLSAAISCIISLILLYHIDIIVVYHSGYCIHWSCIWYYPFLSSAVLLYLLCYKLRRIGFERSNLRHSSTMWSTDVDFRTWKIRVVTHYYYYYLWHIDIFKNKITWCLSSIKPTI